MARSQCLVAVPAVDSISNSGRWLITIFHTWFLSPSNSSSLMSHNCLGFYTGQVLQANSRPSSGGIQDFIDSTKEDYPYFGLLLFKCSGDNRKKASWDIWSPPRMTIRPLKSICMPPAPLISIPSTSHWSLYWCLAQAKGNYSLITLFGRERFHLLHPTGSGYVFRGSKRSLPPEIRENKDILSVAEVI